MAEASGFQGVSENDLIDLEVIFNVAITVFSLKEDGRCDIVWRSKRTGCMKLSLNIHENHFMYIRDTDKLCKSYRCLMCDASFTRARNARRHTCDADKVTEMKYSRGIFAPPVNVWGLVHQETGIDVPASLRFYPYWITYDIESVLLTRDLPTPTATTTFHSEHQLVSVSVCSNVPGFDTPKCFVHETTVDECVSRFVAHVELACAKAEELLMPKYRRLLTAVRNFIKERNAKEVKKSSLKRCPCRMDGLMRVEQTSAD